MGVCGSTSAVLLPVLGCWTVEPVEFCRCDILVTSLLPVALVVPDLVLSSGNSAKPYCSPEAIKRGSLPFKSDSNLRAA